MRTIATVAIVALVVLTTVIGAGAQEPEEDFGRRGWFVGGGLNFAIEQFDVHRAEIFSGVPIDVSNSVGVDVRGGYRVNRWFAAEGNLQYYSGFDLEDAYDTYDWGDTQSFSFFANAKGYPLAGRFQPYGLFGIGVQAASISRDYYRYYDSDTDATFAMKVGGGIDIYFTDHILGYFDVNYMFTASDLNFGGPTSIGTNIIPMSWGVQYRF